MTTSNPPINAEDRKVGLIPLPWFIPMCIFIPSFAAMLGGAIYLHTVKKYRNKKRLAAEDVEKNGGGTEEGKVDERMEVQT